MNTNRKKRVFKTKVIAKLFGQADEDEYTEDQLENDFDDANTIDATRTSPCLFELQAIDAKIYGVHGHPTEHKQDCGIRTDKPASVSSTCSDEDSESFQIPKKRKRRGRHGQVKSGKNEHPTSSSNDITITNGISCQTEDHFPATCSSLTKNQKRKLKKKQRKREKKIQSSSCIEFTFDPSGPTCH